MVNGACPLSLLNMYWIQLVALQALASFPHRRPRALSLLEGASTSRQALYMARRKRPKGRDGDTACIDSEACFNSPGQPFCKALCPGRANSLSTAVTRWAVNTLSRGESFPCTGLWLCAPWARSHVKVRTSSSSRRLSPML